WVLVHAKVTVARVAQPAAVGDAGVGDLHDEPRFYPGDARPDRVGRQPLDERRDVRRDGVEALRQRRDTTAAESRAHLAHEPQTTAGHRAAEQQGPEAGARAARTGEPAYHEVVRLQAGRLEPVVGAAGAVRRAQSLGHDALETEAAGVLVDVG